MTTSTCLHPAEVAHDEELLELLYALAVARSIHAQRASWVMDAALDYRQRSSRSRDHYEAADYSTRQIVTFDELPDGAFYQTTERGSRSDIKVTRIRNTANVERYEGGRPTDITVRPADAAAKLTCVVEAAGDPAEQGYAQRREIERYERLLADLAEHSAKVTVAEDLVIEHESRYTGWQRFWLVVSSAGHVHSSTACSSCYASTRFAPVPSLSASTEAEAIAEVGTTLCTVCFPNAPIDGKVTKVTKAAAKKLTGHNWDM